MASSPRENIHRALGKAQGQLKFAASELRACNCYRPAEFLDQVVDELEETGLDLSHNWDVNDYGRIQAQIAIQWRSDDNLLT